MPVPLAPNDLVDIEVHEGSMPGRYRTRVEAIGSRLVVAVPLYRGQRVLLQIGTKVTVHVLRADRLRGARYRGESQVLSHATERGVAMVALSMPRWERIQLRSFARVDMVLPVRWRRWSGADATSNGWVLDESRDLSGGGLLLWIKQGPAAAPAEGQQVELSIILPDRVVGAVGRVVRHLPQEGREAGIGVAISFVEIAERDRDRLIGLVLRRQAEMRRLGLL